MKLRAARLLLGLVVFVLVPLAVICCLVLVRAGLPREAFAVAVSLAGAMLISDAVKLLVSRPRPPVEHLQSVTGSELSLRAFHTGERVLVLAGLGAAGGTSGTAAYPRGRRPGACAVLAVALSRVYLGVHYPADVIAGVLVGTGWAAFVARCLRRPQSSEDPGVRADTGSCTAL